MLGFLGWSVWNTASLLEFASAGLDCNIEQGHSLVRKNGIIDSGASK